MYVLSNGRKPSCWPPNCQWVLQIAAMALVIPLGACASNTARAPADTWPGSPTRVAGYTAHVERPARVEMEADGQESQSLPYRRETQELDDPSEPFSPNYGRAKVSQHNDNRHVYAAEPPAQGYLKRNYAAN